MVKLHAGWPFALQLAAQLAISRIVRANLLHTDVPRLHLDEHCGNVKDARGRGLRVDELSDRLIDAVLLRTARERLKLLLPALGAAG